MIESQEILATKVRAIGDEALFYKRRIIEEEPVRCRIARPKTSVQTRLKTDSDRHGRK